MALYARVSSDRRDMDLSVAAQPRALRDHADKNGYVVVREYVDEAVSGRVDDRPEFNKMIDEARLPEASFREVLMDWTQSTRKTAVLVGRSNWIQLRAFSDGLRGHLSRHGQSYDSARRRPAPEY